MARCIKQPQDVRFIEMLELQPVPNKDNQVPAVGTWQVLRHFPHSGISLQPDFQLAGISACIPWNLSGDLFGIFEDIPMSYLYLEVISTRFDLKECRLHLADKIPYFEARKSVDVDMTSRRSTGSTCGLRRRWPSLRSTPSLWTEHQLRHLGSLHVFESGLADFCYLWLRA